MKILFLTKYYPPSEGGIERYSYLLCTGLVKLGAQVEVVAASEESMISRKDVIDGVKIYRMGSLTELRGVPISPTLPILVKQVTSRFDLVHLNFPNPLTELAYLAFCRQQKGIITYHSDILRQKIFLKMYRPFIERLLSRMSAIIVTSPNYIESSPFLALNRDRCRIIPLPVDIEALKQEDQTEVQALRVQYGKFVLFVGRLVYYKGLEYLIQAISQLARIRLVIVGRGHLEEVYRRKAEEMGLRTQVTFLGKVTDDHLKKLYHACNCLVLPSTARSEAFGMVLAEAMACGKPVISTELSTGTSFVNQDGETGFVVPPNNACALADKISLLVHDGVLSERLGRKAKERVEHMFRKEIVIERTLELYEEILKNSNSSHKR